MHNPPAPTPTPTRTYGQQAAGTPVLQTSYTMCQYEELSPPIRELGPTVLVRCTDPAMMTAGYSRTCARHIIPLTARAIRAQLERPTHNQHVAAQLQATLTKLENAK